jgi:hypothetical protein
MVVAPALKTASFDRSDTPPWVGMIGRTAVCPTSAAWFCGAV